MKAIKKETLPGEEKSLAVSVAEENQIVNFNVESLMAKAIEHGLSPETMEKFLAMRQQLKAEWAREQFDKAMANFQAECPVIEKNKKVSFGTTNYNYAPLEVIVKQVKQLLSDNGFSYTFNTKEEDKGLTIFCKVKHTAGHMEISDCYIEIDNAAKMNISQKSGSAITYGKRYAFCNAFGILTGDEDNDAIQPEAKKRANYAPGLDAPTEQDRIESRIINDLEACQTPEEYKQVCADIKIGREKKRIDDNTYAIVLKVAGQIAKKIEEKIKSK